MLDTEQDHASPLDTKISEYVAGLNQLQEQREAHLAELERQARVVRQDVQRIKAAVKALTGGEKKKPSGPKKADSPVKEATLNTVMAEIANRGEEGITKLEIEEITNLSTDTVRRALNQLRASEEIRKAGNVPGTNRALYKMMPERVDA